LLVIVVYELVLRAVEDDDGGEQDGMLKKDMFKTDKRHEN
jgi:hypothetical protein